MNYVHTPEDTIKLAFKRINRLTGVGRLNKALALCQELHQEFPDHPRVAQGLGILLFRCGRREEGERLLRRAIELKPDFADAYFNLGNLQRYSWQLEAAESSFRKALEIDPYHYKALSYLAPTLCKQKKWKEAIAFCDRAISLHPKLPEAYVAKGIVMLENGKTREGLSFYQKAFSIKPKNETHSTILFIMNLLPEFTQQQIYAESVSWGGKYAQPETKRSRPHLNSPRAARRLRVGYVSGDFKLHPVSYHLKPVLASHDSTRFEIYLYSCYPYFDQMTAELSGSAHCFRDISLLNDEQAEAVIRQDGIDILVDLSGHTAYHRLTLFARKPAPIQVSWLGYFNTTGMSAMDYLLSDPLTIPEDQVPWFSEKVVTLPGCRFCYEPPSFAPEVARSPASHTGRITFGSFNKLSKTNAAVIALWARVLLAVPDARLILKWPSFDNTDIHSGIFEQFASHGIDAERLVLRPDSPHPEMLAEYGDIDIALDTFPYNGGATTCEALWMGVPVVTLEGTTPISRQSKSFLHAIGHPEWVAVTPDEYVEIARNLASDTVKLSGIRSCLRHQMANSPLCDGIGFTRHLEAAFREMWQAWCAPADREVISSGRLRRFGVDELYNAGVISMNDDDYRSAVTLLNAVVRRQSNHHQAYNNLGISLFKLGRNDAALHAFKRAIRSNSEDGKAYNNLGRLLLEVGQVKKALKICERATELMPDHTDSLINLGIACRDAGRMQKSREVLERVLEIDTSNTLAMINLANILLKSGCPGGAVEQLQHALECEPENFMILSTLLCYFQNVPAARQQEIFQLSSRFGEMVVNSSSGALFSEIDKNVRKDTNNLRVGFVSADFRFHPVGMLLLSFFKHHNPDRLSLFCYNNGRGNDGLTDWYRSTAAGWRDIFALEDSEVANLIRKDRIDILVDLSGHTFGNRLTLFHLRPAPVQATWMGYWHTTGLRSIDYIIADNDFIPPEDEMWFTETVVRLPHNRFCFTPPEPSPFVVDPPVMDNDYITFGCFNNLGKINTEVVSVWSRLLRTVPKSRLILKSKSFSDPAVRRWFRSEFMKNGVNPRRIECRRSSPYFFMLAEYGEIDIVLDPFPFSGGMTSLEALWMGVPIVTLPGDLPISRQTKSFLDLIGLEDLAATGEEDYVSRAIKLANDPQRLCAIRETLRERLIDSPLFDAKSYALSVEDLFCDMWLRGHRNNQHQLNKEVRTC